jgi:hypothetical protein
MVAGVFVLLATVFFPLAHRLPAWPTDLPHLANDDAATLAEHRRALALPTPPATQEVLRAWDAWGRTARSGDATRTQDARRRFGEVLSEATGRSPQAIAALRALATEKFLREIHDPNAPLTRVAMRHGLAGRDAHWYANTTARIAWFALNWHRMTAPEALEGAELPIGDLLLQVPRPMQRAFVSWALSARCYEIMGVTEVLALRPAHVRSCATFRNDLVAIAKTFDDHYPQQEALAVVDTQLALGLQHTVTPDTEAPVIVLNDSERMAAASDAQEAFGRARERYARLIQATPSRRLERHFMAVTSALISE